MPAPLASISRLVDAASRGPESVLRVAGLLPRVAELLDVVDVLLVRADDVLSRLDDSARRLQILVDGVAATEGALPEALETVSGLRSVAPDLTELLVVSRALNELMGALPGLGKTKRRVDDEMARERDADPPDS